MIRSDHGVIPTGAGMVASILSLAPGDITTTIVIGMAIIMGLIMATSEIITTIHITPAVVRFPTKYMDQEGIPPEAIRIE
jgi:hypothetical protein